MDKYFLMVVTTDEVIEAATTRENEAGEKVIVPAKIERVATKCGVSRDPGEVARKVAAGQGRLDFYAINFADGITPSLSKVTEKGRSPAPTREQVEIQDESGDVVGSSIV